MRRVTLHKRPRSAHAVLRILRMYSLTTFSRFSGLFISDEELFRQKLEARKRSAEPGTTETTNFVPRATFEPTAKEIEAKKKASKSAKSATRKIESSKIERPDRRDSTVKVSRKVEKKVITVPEPESRASNRHPETPKDIQQRKQKEKKKAAPVPVC